MQSLGCECGEWSECGEWKLTGVLTKSGKLETKSAKKDTKSGKGVDC